MSAARPRTRGTIARAAVGSLALGLLLTGCATDPLAEQYREGSSKGYVAGDGSVTEIAQTTAASPSTFSGTTEHGAAVRAPTTRARSSS